MLGRVAFPAHLSLTPMMYQPQKARHALLIQNIWKYRIYSNSINLRPENSYE